VQRIAIVIVTTALVGTLTAGRADADTGRPSGPSGVSTGHIPPPKTSPDARSPDQPASLGGQVQLNLSRLEEDLRINAGQQKAWDAYATRVIRLADDVARARFAARDLEGTAITAPELFDRINQTAQNRMTAIEDIVEAGRALYGKLSPEQQKLADRRLALITLSLVSGAPPPGAKPENAPASARPPSP
jgi:LTXXQ motif family protein